MDTYKERLAKNSQQHKSSISIQTEINPNENFKNVRCQTESSFSSTNQLKGVKESIKAVTNDQLDESLKDENEKLVSMLKTSGETLKLKNQEIELLKISLDQKSRSIEALNAGKKKFKEKMQKNSEILEQIKSNHLEYNEQITSKDQQISTLNQKNLLQKQKFKSKMKNLNLEVIKFKENFQKQLNATVKSYSLILTEANAKIGRDLSKSSEILDYGETELCRLVAKAEIAILHSRKQKLELNLKTDHLNELGKKFRMKNLENSMKVQKITDLFNKSCIKINFEDLMQQIKEFLVYTKQFNQKCKEKNAASRKNFELQISNIKTNLKSMIIEFIDKKSQSENVLRNILASRVKNDNKSVEKLKIEHQTQIQGFESEIEHLKNSLETSKAVVTDHSARLADCRRKLAECEIECKELSGQLNLHKDCNDQIASFGKEIEVKDRFICDLKSKLKICESECDNLEQSYRDLQYKLGEQKKHEKEEYYHWNEKYDFAMYEREKAMDAVKKTLEKVRLLKMVTLKANKSELDGIEQKIAQTSTDFDKKIQNLAQKLSSAELRSEKILKSFESQKRAVNKKVAEMSKVFGQVFGDMMIN